LNVSLVQKESSLDPGDNREAVAAAAEALGGNQPGEQLLVFPEAFMRDFGKPGSDISAYAEKLDGPFVETLTDVAGRHGITIVAGMFEVSDDPARPYNTLVVVDAHGVQATYRKIHLYDSFGYKESDRLLAGALEPVIVDVGRFRVGLMTCYDLRFPELSRALTLDGAELVVVPSAWVAGPGKADHWCTLVKARAIENTVYVAAVGQPGPRYTGRSVVVGPAGELLAEAGDGEYLLQASVDHEGLREARATNPSLANRRL